MERKENAVWNLQVPKPLDEALDKAIALDFHLTKSEFIRAAVREKLAQYNIREPMQSEVDK